VVRVAATTSGEGINQGAVTGRGIASGPARAWPGVRWPLVLGLPGCVSLGVARPSFARPRLRATQDPPVRGLVMMRPVVVRAVAVRLVAVRLAALDRVARAALVREPIALGAVGPDAGWPGSGGLIRARLRLAWPRPGRPGTPAWVQGSRIDPGSRVGVARSRDRAGWLGGAGRCCGRDAGRLWPGRLARRRGWTGTGSVGRRKIVLAVPGTTLRARAGLPGPGAGRGARAGRAAGRRLIEALPGAAVRAGRVAGSLARRPRARRARHAALGPGAGSARGQVGRARAPVCARAGAGVAVAGVNRVRLGRQERGVAVLVVRGRVVTATRGRAAGAARVLSPARARPGVRGGALEPALVVVGRRVGIRVRGCRGPASRAPAGAAAWSFHPAPPGYCVQARASGGCTLPLTSVGRSNLVDGARPANAVVRQGFIKTGCGPSAPVIPAAPARPANPSRPPAQRPAPGPWAPPRTVARAGTAVLSGPSSAFSACRTLQFLLVRKASSGTHRAAELAGVTMLTVRQVRAG
jgi:hypothetical protein